MLIVDCFSARFLGAVVEKVRVSLDKAYLEKCQCYFPTFKLQADYRYPLWELMLIVQDSGSGFWIPLLLCLISGSWGGEGDRLWLVWEFPWIKPTWRNPSIIFLPLDCRLTTSVLPEYSCWSSIFALFNLWGLWWRWRGYSWIKPTWRNLSVIFLPLDRSLSTSFSARHDDRQFWLCLVSWC